jgi:hypothetical protein
VRLTRKFWEWYAGRQVDDCPQCRKPMYEHDTAELLACALAIGIIKQDEVERMTFGRGSTNSEKNA